MPRIHSLSRTPAGRPRRVEPSPPGYPNVHTPMEGLESPLWNEPGGYQEGAILELRTMVLSPGSHVEYITQMRER